MSIRPEGDALPGETGDMAEIVAAIRACSLGLPAGGAATFRPAAGSVLAREFEAWIAGTFRILHAPHFLRVCHACRDGGAREVAALDCDYGARLMEDGAAAPLAGFSRQAGRDVVEALSGARHLRLLDQLRASIHQGAMPGHFATMLACQATVFHVAPAHGLMALAFLEWRFAGGHRGIPAGVAPEVAFARMAVDASLPGVISALLRDERSESEPHFACA